MTRACAESLRLLLRFEWTLRFRDFRELHRIVREEPVRPTAPAELIPYAELCRAMNYACVFYFRRVLCLHRSAATAVLLRRHGWSAELVIGAQTLPFRSHAWCEVGGAVVNDRPYMRDIYAVLERC
jgi:hypothetical protein